MPPRFEGIFIHRDSFSAVTTTDYGSIKMLVICKYVLCYLYVVVLRVEAPRSHHQPSVRTFHHLAQSQVCNKMEDF